MNFGKLKVLAGRSPKTSGVYFMKNASGRVIYIGKANNLRARLRNYFYPEVDIKTQSLMREVRSIQVRKTSSDLDALLLEAILIRELKPLYNMQLTDDKSFPLLAVTHEEFPRVFITRERGKSNIIYYGPFIGSTDLRHAFRTLQHIFKFRACKYKIESSTGQPADRHTGKPKNCLLAHINLCLAPCLGKTDTAQYQENITSLEDFFRGDKASLNKRLTRLMSQASRQQDYEIAAGYRDQMKALDNISEVGKLGPFYEEAFLVETPQQKLQSVKEALGLSSGPVRIEGVDISDIKGLQAVGSVVVFKDGEPVNNLYRRFKIKQSSEGMADDYGRIREVVRRRFAGLRQESVRVDLLLIDGGKGHVNAASEMLFGLGINGPIIVGLAKGKKRDTVYLLKAGAIVKMRMSRKLRLLAYVRDEAHRFAHRYHHLRRSKEALQ